jgi:hypothetical protein
LYKKNVDEDDFEDCFETECVVFIEICDLRINLKKFWIRDVRTGTPKEFAVLRLRNAPKNLQVCDLRTSKKFACPHLVLRYCTVSTKVSFNLLP